MALVFDNEYQTKENQIEPRIKLNYNIHVYNVIVILEKLSNTKYMQPLIFVWSNCDLHLFWDNPPLTVGGGGVVLTIMLMGRCKQMQIV